MTKALRSLIAPGGFSNLVGHYVAALDVGSVYTVEAAESGLAAGDAAGACTALGKIGALESAWIHRAVGGVPTPPPPEDETDVAAWLGWLEAVRTISIMVLRPLADRELERLVTVPGDEDGPRTLKRLLSELLYLQGRLAGHLDGRLASS